MTSDSSTHELFLEYVLVLVSGGAERSELTSDYSVLFVDVIQLNV